MKEKNIEEIILECNNLVNYLSEMESGFLELCGKDDEICYQEAKNALSKMKDVRDFIKSCI